MSTDAERLFARAEILEACLDTYETSPAAWVGWEREDIAEYDLIEAAARELVDEGLIKAIFADDHTAVEAQLTPAGLANLQARRGT